MTERDGGFAFGGRERERHVGKEVMEQIFCEPIAVILMPGLVFLLAMLTPFCVVSTRPRRPPQTKSR